MTLFYHPLAAPDKLLEFDHQESTHIVRVLRMREGQDVWITNGRGLKISGCITSTSKNVFVQLAVDGEIMPPESRLSIAVAPTKNADRLEWFVEKAVEIGVEKIQLIECRHSERVFLKTERLQRVAVAALKQSQRFYLPEIEPVIGFRQWMENCGEDQRFIAHCRADMPKELLRDSLKPGLRTSIAIGPEGDFSKEEIENAIVLGFRGVSLGNARLRTETAALAAVHTFELINQI